MKITIVGTGNVAFHLGKRLFEQGVQINEVIGRNRAKTAELAAVLSAKPMTYSDNMDTSSDIFLLAVSDNAIAEVAEKLSKTVHNALVVHTSGAMPSTVLKPFFRYFGIFYPLQTFSIARQPYFDDIPIFINVSFASDLGFLKQLAEKVSPRVYEISDDDRMTLHIAAVFVNNFANHLFRIGAEIVAKQQLPFDILLPLIEETVNKIRENSPHDMQTGPAKRGDDKTIDKHLAFIQEHTPQYYLIYKLLSISINNNIKINKYEI